MDSRQFEVIKRELTIKVVNELMAEHMWSENEAISRFMGSDVYRCLQDECTKVWHLSHEQLVALFNDEMCGKLVWPEVA